MIKFHIVLVSVDYTWQVCMWVSKTGTSHGPLGWVVTKRNITQVVSYVKGTTNYVILHNIILIKLMSKEIKVQFHDS